MGISPLSNEQTNLFAELCSALADPKRLLSLHTLAEGPRNGSNLVGQIDISQPAASRHLKVLRDSDLVHSIRQGSSVEYHLVDQRLIEALDLLRLVRDRLVYRVSLV